MTVFNTYYSSIDEAFGYLNPDLQQQKSLKNKQGDVYTSDLAAFADQHMQGNKKTSSTSGKHAGKFNKTKYQRRSMNGRENKNINYNHDDEENGEEDCNNNSNSAIYEKFITSQEYYPKEKSLATLTSLPSSQKSSPIYQENNHNKISYQEQLSSGPRGHYHHLQASSPRPNTPPPPTSQQQKKKVTYEIIQNDDDYYNNDNELYDFETNYNFQPSQIIDPVTKVTINNEAPNIHIDNTSTRNKNNNNQYRNNNNKFDFDYNTNEEDHSYMSMLSNKYMDDDSYYNESRNRKNKNDQSRYIDLILYLISGIILIFIMEQFVKIGIHMSN